MSNFQTPHPTPDTPIPNPQSLIPLLTALRQMGDRPHAAFYTPGHKRGQGASRSLLEVFGQQVFRYDLPELPGLDNLFSPEGVIEEAETLAAEAFGSDRTFFLVNGSTCGIEAAVLATCNPGEKIVLPRNVHQSAISALILSGAVPIFIEPELDADWQIAHSMPPDRVAEALRQHPDSKAVMMVYPTYYGVCGDVEAIAQICHSFQVPLLVDEAHAPHFVFHPDLPLSALAAGADLTVQSIHKVLGAMTQAAMLHVQSDRIDRERLKKALSLVQSTSPSYVLLASLDAARQQMALEGKELLTQAIALADQAKARLRQIPGLKILDFEGATPGCVAIDRTRLTVDVTGLGMTGFEADEILHQALGVIAELPTLNTLTFIITIGNTPDDIERLIAGFQTLASQHHSNVKQRDSFSSQPLLGESAITPRQAFFSPSETCPIAQALDRISAELVCPYPPGIPVLLPGERVTKEAIAYLQHILASGGILTGCADPSLQTLKIVNQ